MNVEGRFCIDSTEVTKAQYIAFLDDPESARIEQPPGCGWNVVGDGGAPGTGSFEPTERWPPSPAELLHPVSSVDWCDAWAYCHWAGKRLCGRVDRGPVDFEDYKTTESELYFACSRNGERAYPYGAEYDADACATERSQVPVGSLVGCVGGYEGIYDLSGNVAEWQEGCRADQPGGDGRTDNCRLGPWDAWPNTNLAFWSCGGDLSSSRSTTMSRYGIRCCSDSR